MGGKGKGAKRGQFTAVSQRSSSNGAFQSGRDALPSSSRHGGTSPRRARASLTFAVKLVVAASSLIPCGLPHGSSDGGIPTRRISPGLDPPRRTEAHEASPLAPFVFFRSSWWFPQ